MNTALEQLPIPLLDWYRENARALPWREDPTPYHVWLSEIMLQQTRVAAVIERYQQFLRVCPTVADLARLPQDRLMKLWEGLGYYSRARNLRLTAQRVVEEYGGQFPAGFEALRGLPGVGEYTAGAICSIAFGIPVPAVDGNVLRVVSRLTGDEGDITAAAVKRRAAAMLREVIPTQAPGAFNQALMELGAIVCLPNGAPVCGQCPAAEFCQARLTGRTEELPVKAPRKARRVEERDVYLIFFQKKVALRRRPPRGLLAGLWEFPSEPAPSRRPVAGRESGTRTGRHIFTHVEWHMTAHIIHMTWGGLPQGWVWADRRALKETYAIPSAFSDFAPVWELYL